jgi:hypothetical protein
MGAASGVEVGMGKARVERRRRRKRRGRKKKKRGQWWSDPV